MPPKIASPTITKRERVVVDPDTDAAPGNMDSIYRELLGSQPLDALASNLVSTSINNNKNRVPKPTPGDGDSCGEVDDATSEDQQSCSGSSSWGKVKLVKPLAEGAEAGEGNVVLVANDGKTRFPAKAKALRCYSKMAAENIFHGDEEVDEDIVLKTKHATPAALQHFVTWINRHATVPRSKQATPMPMFWTTDQYFSDKWDIAFIRQHFVGEEEDMTKHESLMGLGALASNLQVEPLVEMICTYMCWHIRNAADLDDPIKEVNRWCEDNQRNKPKRSLEETAAWIRQALDEVCPGPRRSFVSGSDEYDKVPCPAGTPSYQDAGTSETAFATTSSIRPSTASELRASTTGADLSSSSSSQLSNHRNRTDGQGSPTSTAGPHFERMSCEELANVLKQNWLFSDGSLPQLIRRAQGVKQPSLLTKPECQYRMQHGTRRINDVLGEYTKWVEHKNPGYGNSRPESRKATVVGLHERYALSWAALLQHYDLDVALGIQMWKKLLWMVMIHHNCFNENKLAVLVSLPELRRVPPALSGGLEFQGRTGNFRALRPLLATAHDTTGQTMQRVLCSAKSFINEQVRDFVVGTLRSGTSDFFELLVRKDYLDLGVNLKAPVRPHLSLLSEALNSASLATVRRFVEWRQVSHGEWMIQNTCCALNNPDPTVYQLAKTLPYYHEEDLPEHLIYAIENRRVREAQEIVAIMPEPNDGYWSDILEISAQHATEEVFEVIDKRAGKDLRGRGLLHMAVSNGNLDAVKYLLKSNVDLGDQFPLEREVTAVSYAMSLWHCSSSEVQCSSPHCVIPLGAIDVLAYLLSKVPSPYELGITSSALVRLVKAISSDETFVISEADPKYEMRSACRNDSVTRCLGMLNLLLDHKVPVTDVVKRVALDQPRSSAVIECLISHGMQLDSTDAL